ncbi:uncharacterized protein LOC109492654 [Felis catus]|uniref:uncharacterized protein LOC109492654 n=1 Tax=Felis catus TaxID=9685 RepID=UPI001D19B60E|nr:uncharacterized protein LOC109492654 [Felis catus]
MCRQESVRVPPCTCEHVHASAEGGGGGGGAGGGPTGTAAFRPRSRPLGTGRGFGGGSARFPRSVLPPGGRAVSGLGEDAARCRRGILSLRGDEGRRGGGEVGRQELRAGGRTRKRPLARFSPNSRLLRWEGWVVPAAPAVSPPACLGDGSSCGCAPASKMRASSLKGDEVLLGCLVRSRHLTSPRPALDIPAAFAGLPGGHPGETPADSHFCLPDSPRKWHCAICAICIQVW